MLNHLLGNIFVCLCKWYHLTSLFKTGNLSGNSAYRPANSSKGQLLLQRLKSDLRRSVNGPPQELNTPSQEPLRCLRIEHKHSIAPAADEAHGIALIFESVVEQAKRGHYFSKWGLQHLLLVLPDKAYLSNTRLCLPLLTRGHGSVWLWVHTVTQGRLSPLEP